MYYVYLLKSEKDKGFYIGYTEDIEFRTKNHAEGIVTSTQHRRPLQLIYFEAYTDKKSAIERELKLKDFGSAYTALLKRLKFK